MRDCEKGEGFTFSHHDLASDSNCLAQDYKNRWYLEVVSFNGVFHKCNRFTELPLDH